MKAIESQIGGEHYKNMKFQPIQLITSLKCSFIQGCIIKYITRYKYKNGAEDIKKCINYAQLAIELNNRKCCDPDALFQIKKYINDNQLSMLQQKILTGAIYNKYKQVIACCNLLLELEYTKKS